MFATFVESDNTVRHFLIAGIVNFVGVGTKFLPLAAQFFALILQFGKTLVNAHGNFFNIRFIFGQMIFGIYFDVGAISRRTVDTKRNFIQYAVTQIHNFLSDFFFARRQQNLGFFVGFFLVLAVFLLHFLIDLGGFGYQQALQNRHINLVIQGLLINSFAGIFIGSITKLLGSRIFRAAGSAQRIFGGKLGGSNQLGNHFVTLFTLNNFSHRFAVFFNRMGQLNLRKLFTGSGINRVFFVQRIIDGTEFFNRLCGRCQSGIQTHVHFDLGFDVLEQGGKLCAIFFFANQSVIKLIDIVKVAVLNFFSCLFCVHCH